MKAAIVAVLALTLVGCDALVPVKPDTPEVRTITVRVNVPIPVPCFLESDRPKMPDATPVNVDTATTEQLAAAELADALAMDVYTAAVDRLFVACTKIELKGKPS